MTADILHHVTWNGEQVPVYDMDTIDFGKVISSEPAELRGWFFDQPVEAKNQFGLVSPHLGYEPIGSRNGVLKDTRDGYEMIKVSRDEIQKALPHVPDVLKESADLKALENAIASCNIVSKAVLTGLSTALGLTGEERFENRHRNERPSTTTLAMMHYIPANPSQDKHVGHQKHTDISSLTLLFAEQWGLQIRPPGTRQFGFVPPSPAAVVPYDHTEHRYSIAYFLRAENDTMFTDSEGRWISAGQWHDEKFMAFKAAPEIQALAPKSMLFGGMDEDEVPAVAVPAEPVQEASNPVMAAA
ncbi:unnamed protein product [Parascedosporium putredinis]|uniref:Isopenicillin N synthase-like Fe(2+) 2OG dioxygenase domain-containing protein n=1 Tax=Parascedosporium putredinis TaxID=1442378 RepID=A0A9P1GZR6_9PEZI|nr:unnamed protein product [Parascedosporium putredinis]CAI7991926.1 unnamed protein product [Parascedosporium putredinis]